MSLPARPMRVVRRHLPSVDSTNTYARTHARAFEPDAVTVVTADEQTAGKGRLGRSWKSGAGSDITATFAFRVPPERLPSAYQLSPFIAVVAHRVFHKRGLPVQIKWPNDLLLSGCKKFAGILCELETTPDGAYWAALGIGINVNSVAEELGANLVRPAWPLTTLRSETGTTFDVGALTEELVGGFAEVRRKGGGAVRSGARRDLCSLFQPAIPDFRVPACLCPPSPQALPVYLADGFAPFQAEYEAANVLLGKVIRFSEGAGKPHVQGRVLSLGADGKLNVEVAPSSSATLLTLMPMPSAAQ
jgi:biotin-[acetyl-CoA-carboxylase] ligase BirA-like protein